jgi:succinate dehydrogenase hydrophobic anchor subunit
MSAILWTLQRASGLLLVLLVALHLGAQAALFPVPLRRHTLLGIDAVLLGAVLYHGVAGVRTIAHDYLRSAAARRAADVGLWCAGAALAAYGVWRLAAYWQ